MKVLCVNDTDCLYIRKGEIYEVYIRDGDYYLPDIGIYYPQNRFTTLDYDVRTCADCGLTDPQSDEDVGNPTCKHRWIDP